MTGVQTCALPISFSTLQNAVGIKLIEKLFEYFDIFQLRDGLKFPVSEIVRVSKDDVITESVKSVYIHAVCNGTDKFQQSLPHRYRSCIGIGQA